MNRYTVVQTIQGGDNEPVEVKFHCGADRMEAYVALGQAMHEAESIPAGFQIKVLGVRIDIESGLPDRCSHGFSYLGRCPQECHIRNEQGKAFGSMSMAEARREQREHPEQGVDL